jgi:hypothetical protein
MIKPLEKLCPFNGIAVVQLTMRLPMVGKLQNLPLMSACLKGKKGLGILKDNAY